MVFHILRVLCVVPCAGYTYNIKIVNLTSVLYIGNVPFIVYHNGMLTGKEKFQ
jgi:hypothetical protein